MATVGVGARDILLKQAGKETVSADAGKAAQVRRKMRPKTIARIKPTTSSN